MEKQQQVTTKDTKAHKERHGNARESEYAEYRKQKEEEQ
jgi:hypothetical protein